MTALSSAVARSSDLPQGTRVECVDGRGNRRIAMITGRRVDDRHRGAYIELIPEGSTSGVPEIWPIEDVTPLPKRQQLPALGGQFNAPKGYPYVTQERP
ncbi:MAG: hypothetical protein ACO4B5_11465 [Steroidobacteraceae bacterium]